jgi:hypothetical protein
MMSDHILSVGIAGYSVAGRWWHIYIDQHHRLRTVEVCDIALPEDSYLEDGINSYKYKRDSADGGILLDQGTHIVDLMLTKSGMVGFLHSLATMWPHCFNLEILLERGVFFQVPKVMVR